MTDLTIEHVREHVRVYETAKSAYSAANDEGSPSRNKVREAQYQFQDAGDRFCVAHARLALALHTQLQQEREGREKLEKFLRAFINGQSLLSMFKAQEHAIAAQAGATPDSGGGL